jgi:hypothetical protein
VADEQDKLRAPRLRSVFAALGAVLSLWAAGLGIYSAAVAQPIPCGRCGDDGAAVSAVRHALVLDASIAVACAACALGVIVLPGVWARRRGAEVKGAAVAAWPVVAVLAATVLTLLIVPAATDLNPATLVGLYPRAMNDFTVTDELPTALAAIVLAATGCLVLAAGRAVPLRGHRWATIVGAGIALVLGAACTAAAVRAGDDTRYVEATTAAAQAIPPVPDTLGRRRFHLTVANQLPFNEHAAESPEYAPVFAAGTGFLVWRSAAGGVFAYDATGRERWHYRRTGPNQVRIVGVHLYERGRTVVLKVGAGTESDNPVLVGLDAVSGQRLWQSNNAMLDDAFDGGGDGTPTPFLVARHKSAWLGFDARTGEQIWQITDPLQCGGEQDADTATRLASIEDCSTGQRREFRLITADPDTGRLLGDRQVLAAAVQPSRAILMVDVKPVSSAGLRLWVGYEHGKDTITYLNATTGDTADIGGAWLLVQRRRVGDPLGEASLPARLIRYGPDGRPRCEVPASGRLSNAHAVDHPGIAWLGKQFVYLAAVHDAAFLQVVDRNTCATVSTLPDAFDTLDLIEAPGATLVRSQTRDGDITIDGYAP